VSCGCVECWHFLDEDLTKYACNTQHMDNKKCLPKTDEDSTQDEQDLDPQKNKFKKD
jgi:hypothetical protein